MEKQSVCIVIQFSPVDEQSAGNVPQILRRTQHCRFGQDNATLLDYMGDKLGTDVFIPSVQPDLEQHRAHSQQTIGIHASVQLEMLQFVLKDQSLMRSYRNGGC